MNILLAAAIFVLLAASSLSAEAATRTRETSRAMTNTVTEWTFTSSKERSDPFNQIELDAVFTDPKGATLRVPAFWAGGRTWKLRYASPLAGKHTFRTVCSDTSDAGLHSVTGVVEIRKYRGANALLKHGPVKVSPNRRTFTHEDGTPFFWLGDTWWMGLCKRLGFPEEFERLLDDRVKKGFTVVQIVAGLYPDMPALDPRGANEAGYPWERAGGPRSVAAGADGAAPTKPEDYLRINPAYFDAADRRIARLVERGIAPCIVGAWGYHLPWLGPEKLKKHWRYLVARWGAYPVFWCVAGEANLPYYLAPGFPYDDRKQVTGWTQIARHLRKLDPYRRPMSIHPTGLGKLSARYAIDDQSLIDFDMLQTGHGDRGSLGPTVDTMRMSYAEKPTMPVLNSEVCYEGILNSCGDDVQRLMFWSSMLSGGCGHTYGANGIWQMNQPGIPYGNSPHGGTYGPTPWTEAMNLPGSKQLGLAKKLLVSLGVERFEPLPDAATYRTENRAAAWGRWIWYPEGRPNQDAPVEARFFRRTVEIGRSAVKRAVLRVGADDRCTVWVNGKEAGWQTGWRSPLMLDITKLLRAGKNVVAVRAENMPAPVTKNPAGLISALDVEFANGTRISAGSGAEWRCAKTETPGWTARDFDDSPWAVSMEIGGAGMAPWGAIEGEESPHMQPYAAGTEAGPRIYYLPAAREVTLRHLHPGGGYEAYWWNPISAKRTTLGVLRADQSGELSLNAPPVSGQDWVLVLRPRRE